MPKGHPLVGLTPEEKKARHVAKTQEALKRRVAAMSPEEFEAYRARSRAYTAKHRASNREKLNESSRQAAKARRAERPGENAERCRASYAKHRKERRAAVKARWPEIRDAENARRRAHHHAHRNEANARRKERLQTMRTSRPWIPLLHAAKYRSKKRGLDFALTEEWAMSRWTGACELTGIPFRLGGRESGPKFFSPSIDRIDRTRGYVPENCRFLLWAVNAMKYDGTDLDMLMLAKAVVAALEPRTELGH